MIREKRNCRADRAWRGLLSICSLVSLCVVVGCSDDTVTPELPVSTHDPVYNDDGGFVITERMLDKRYNEITFPGTHNSFAGADWPSTCENQDLTILQQLENGIRYIEFDIEASLYVYHGGCRGYLNERLAQIAHYAWTHPNQVITVRISDLTGLSAASSFERMNGRLEDTGLASFVYNWDPTKPKWHGDRCPIPDPWPTLREMIDSGRNVMFLHHRDTFHGVVDEGLCRGLSYGDGKLYWFYEAKDPEQLCKLMSVWSAPAERQHNGAHRLFLAECCPEGAPAGSKEGASKNNDGRKLYQLARQQEREIIPDNRCVNFLNVDYYMTSHAGALPVDVVDACNRLNYERFGISWKTADCFWEMYPYEFHRSKAEFVSRAAGVKNDVNAAVYDHQHKVDLDGHEDKGSVVATTYANRYDWKHIPEWAVDNDYFTRWCGSSSGDNHTWGIDLGKRQPVGEIAIAWEYAHKRPAYVVYASNDTRFADGISDDELLEDANWHVVAQGEKLTNVPAMLWDLGPLDGGNDGEWRFFKIKVTDADTEHWPSFYEVKLYGL